MASQITSQRFMKSDLCKNEIQETHSFDSMKSMKNNRTPGLTKEFYENF